MMTYFFKFLSLTGTKTNSR